jgi:hypothetical protein
MTNGKNESGVMTTEDNINFFFPNSVKSNRVGVFFVFKLLFLYHPHVLTAIMISLAVKKRNAEREKLQQHRNVLTYKRI